MDTWNFLPKLVFFYILVVLKLDRGQISFSLLENSLVARQLAVLATRIAFKTFWPRHAQKSKFWKFLDEKVTYDFRLFDFWIFFPFPFYPRFFFLLLWLAIFRACLGLKKISGRVIEVVNFYHGAARCSGRKFGSEFFAQLLSIFGHICGFNKPITVN